MNNAFKRASWDEYFMQIARIVASRSTCLRVPGPNGETVGVGAVIVRNKTILATGYNGSIRGLAHCTDEGHMMENDHCVRTVHAEANALLNANADVEGCRIYTNLYPCNECAKLLIQKGIKEIIYCSDKYAHLDIWKASKKMIRLAGIKTRKYNPKYKIKVTKK